MWLNTQIAVICMLPVMDTSPAVFFTECLWSNLETSFFKQLVILYQRVSQIILSDFLKDVKYCPESLYHLAPSQTVTLQMLQILYQVRKHLDPD